MAHYFVSDIHLRPDFPDRGERFTRFVSSLDNEDSLTVVGDLCDFWMATRQSETEMRRCDGLAALADFRSRGGSLAIMAGNHDLWLCPFYAKALDATIVEEPLDLTIDGLRLRLVHGHLLGARAPWKGIMESRTFFQAFSLIPDPLAHRLDAKLAVKNSRDLLADEERHLAVYRPYADALAGLSDLVIFGHVHRPVDERRQSVRMIVLGGWQYGSSHLKIEAGQASYFLDRISQNPSGSSRVRPDTSR